MPDTSRGRQAARGIDAVGDDHHRAAAAGAGRRALGGLGNRVMQRGGPERIDLPQRTLQGTRIDRERGHLVQPAVKREQRGFVAARL